MSLKLSQKVMRRYTKEPVLTEITAEEFVCRKDYWKRDQLRLHSTTLYARIDGPIMVPLRSTTPKKDYFTLLELLLEHPYADELCVRGNEGWKRQYTRKLSYKNLGEMAQIAANDKFKINYLSLKFKDAVISENIRVPKLLDRPTLEFTECDTGPGRAIVGYQTVFPTAYEQMFTLIKTGQKEKYHFVHGLWVPPEGISVKATTTS